MESRIHSMLSEYYEHMDDRIASVFRDSASEPTREQQAELREIVNDAVREAILYIKMGKSVHERFVQHVVMHAVDAIIGIEKEGLIFFWNRGAEQTFGYTQEEVLGRSIEFILPDGDGYHEESQLLHERTLELGFVRDHHTKRRTRDGRTVMVSMSLTKLVDEDGETLGTIAIIRDTTEMRQLERQVIQNEKLAIIGQIAAGVAHEIGTPLNIISGIAEVLMLDRPVGHVEREDLETIIGQTDRITKLIRELLAFARPQPFHFGAVDIADELQRTIGLLKGKADKLGIEIRSTMADGLPRLPADPHHVQQVFLNLLVNAVDALATLPASAERRIDVTSEFVNDEIVIHFSDSGPGIQRDLAGRIFEPFVTTKDVGKGTGLGLAVCKRIIEEHGGTIEAESEEGRGATFTLRFRLPSR